VKDSLGLRKIIKIGPSYGVTLPPSWVRKVKQRGVTQVLVVEKDDGSLLIKPLYPDELI